MLSPTTRQARRRLVPRVCSHAIASRRAVGVTLPLRRLIQSLGIERPLGNDLLQATVLVLELLKPL